MVQRRRPRYVCARSQQLDARRTVWQAARQDGLLSSLLYRERPREHRLMLLLDGSESFRQFVLWTAVAAHALRRALGDLLVWIFERGLTPLATTADSPAAIVAQLRRGQSRDGYSVRDLPALVEQLARRSSSTAQCTLLVISDLLLPPEAALSLSCRLLLTYAHCAVFVRSASSVRQRSISRMKMLTATSVCRNIRSPASRG